MIRLFLLLMMAGVALSASQVEKKIQRSKKTLQSAVFKKRQMNQQLSKIAATIQRTRKDLNKMEKILDRLGREQKKGEADYSNARRQIQEVESQIAALDQHIQRKHERFIRLLSDQFSMIVAMEEMNRKSEKSVILKEVYDAYRQINDLELKKLKAAIDASRKKKISLLMRRATLKRSVAGIVKKRKLYEKKKKEAQKLLGKLAVEEALYRKKLQNLMSRQKMLRETLAKLNILRKEEIKEAKRREAKRKAQLQRRVKRLAALRRKKEQERSKALAQGREVDYSTVQLPETEQSGKVKQYGSSYQRERVARYRGRKTRAPFSGARVVKKFGPYVDPIYKIRIFNDSVTLKAPSPDTKVRTVLNGKVVYVGENSILGKVVIVQHGAALHTVYAGLSKISPLIKTGSRIRKGTVIGKVRKKLIFQATQHSKLINPLQLIRI